MIKLSVGQYFRNYRVLVEALGLPCCDGSSKIKQIKKLKKLVSFERDGHAYIIKESVEFSEKTLLYKRVPHNDNGVWLVPLTKGYQAKIDEEDIDRICVNSWSYANGYAANSTILMHRFILSAPPHLLVDHINGDKLDNRKENLRLATAAQNNRNCTVARGTSYSPGFNRWSAQITYFGETIYLGFYDTEAEAHAAYRGARAVLGYPL